MEHTLATQSDSDEHINEFEVHKVGNASESIELTLLPTFSVLNDPQFAKKCEGREYIHVDEKSRYISEVVCRNKLTGNELMLFP